jgi:predicted RNA-binding protein with PIN domain
MSVHIVIDGYNLIRRSPTLSPIDRKDIQLGRDALIDRLAAYKRVKGHQVTVVFDGASEHASSGNGYTEKGIRIRFSRHGETADSVINRIAARERSKALVVSSDQAVADFSAAHGAATISAAGFEEKMEMAAFMDVKGTDTGSGAEEGWSHTTKKKGPSRRLSKKGRQNRKRLTKL